MIKGPWTRWSFDWAAVFVLKRSTLGHQSDDLLSPLDACPRTSDMLLKHDLEDHPVGFARKLGGLQRKSSQVLIAAIMLVFMSVTVVFPAPVKSEKLFCEPIQWLHSYFQMCATCPALQYRLLWGQMTIKNRIYDKGVL